MFPQDTERDVSVFRNGILEIRENPLTKNILLQSWRHELHVCCMDKNTHIVFVFDSDLFLQKCSKGFETFEKMGEIEKEIPLSYDVYFKTCSVQVKTFLQTLMPLTPST